MLRRRVTDHRHRPIRLYGVQDGLPGIDSRDAVPSAIKKRIDGRLRSTLNTANWATAIASTVACTFAGMSLVPLLLKSGLSMYVWAPSLLMFLVLLNLGVVLAARWFIHRRHTASIVGAFLAERRCPACGYDLAGANPDAEGFTVCPECGAAWQAPSPDPAAQ